MEEAIEVTETVCKGGCPIDYTSAMSFFKNMDWKKILMIAIVAIVVLGGGYLIYKYFFKKKTIENPEKHKENKDAVSSLLSELTSSDEKEEEKPPVNVENTALYPYFDVEINDENVGRIIFQMLDDEAPKTCRNFRHLCGKNILNNSKRPSYQGVPFHRIIKDFMIQGGDITNGDGTGGYSIYGEKFEDENLTMEHNQPGLLSMANAGPNSNGSQFFITTKEAPWLNGKHVVFGIVMKGMEIVQRLENVQTDDEDKPRIRCRISKSGLITQKEFDQMEINKKVEMEIREIPEVRDSDLVFPETVSPPIDD
jgi:cyclophilin family peptidyl-prolyl cis-trans isomerase